MAAAERISTAYSSDQVPHHCLHPFTGSSWLLCINHKATSHWFQDFFMTYRPRPVIPHMLQSVLCQWVVPSSSTHYIFKLFSSSLPCCPSCLRSSRSMPPPPKKKNLIVPLKIHLYPGKKPPKRKQPSNPPRRKKQTLWTMARQLLLCCDLVCHSAQPYNLMVFLYSTVSILLLIYSDFKLFAQKPSFCSVFLYCLAQEASCSTSGSSRCCCNTNR